MKKIAVLIYPHFSLQEISTLTSTLALWFGEKPDFIGSELIPYPSEDGFMVVPTKKYSEVNANDYDCIILPGMSNPLPALHDKHVIDFLSGITRNDLIIAAISSSPILLAKSGKLSDRKFTAGFFMQMVETFPFIQKENFVHQPILEDGNYITAIGFAFREFAQLVLKRLGYDVGEQYMLPVTRQYREEELTFYWDEHDYKDFLNELNEYL